jgi:hypothetical protein
MKEFAVFKNVSIEFLRFIEKFLSIGKCDPGHNNSVAFSNCMSRIPGSYNSVCKVPNLSNQVTIKHSWNQKTRFPIKLLLGDFLASLVDKDSELTKKVTI